MERVTLRIPEQQIDQVEQLVETGEFPNRSEAIRSAVRELINDKEHKLEDARERTSTGWAKV